MFRVISILSILLVIFITAKIARSQSNDSVSLVDWLRHKMKDFGDTLQRLGKVNFSENLPLIKTVFYGATLVSFLLLVLTGFLPVVFTGAHLSGFFLMIHMVAGPVFAFGMVGLTLLYAYQLRISGADWERLYQVFRRDTQKSKFVAENGELFKKITFWMAIVLSIPLISSVALSMYPIYGPAGQETLLELHGYAGLALLLVFVVYFWSEGP